MTIVIRDSRVVAGVKPSEFLDYLRLRGWQLIDKASRSVLWAPPPTVRDKDVEVLIPLEIETADYDRSVVIAINQIAHAEDRSALQVLSDIRISATDVVRVRAMVASTGHDSVPLALAPRLFHATHNLLLAAACAAHDPRASYPARKPPPALSFMRRAQLGQTEPGSFVIRVVSPVPRKRDPSQIPLDLGESLPPPAISEEPFERQVTITLARALSAAREAAKDWMISGPGDVFARQVSSGVSANFCDALASARDEEGVLSSVAVAVSWAQARPRPRDLGEGHEVVFARDMLDVLEEAGRDLAEKEPMEDFRVRGVVTRCHREGDAAGEATVWTPREAGEPIKVRIRLGKGDYEKAIDAHKMRTPVSCTGSLERQGRQYRLRDPRNFMVDADD